MADLEVDIIPTDGGAKQSEKIVAAAILRDPKLVDELALLVSPDDFTDIFHRAVVDVSFSLARNGKPIDLATVADSAAVRSIFGDDAQRLHDTMVDLWKTFCGNAPHHAKRVRERAILRRLSAAGRAIAARGDSPTGPASQMVHESEMELHAVGEGAAKEAVKVSNVVNEVFDLIDARTLTGRAAGMACGLTGVDQLTGGFKSGELVIVAARPSVGKTSLALAFARNVSMGGPVLFASLEQSRIELTERLFSAETGMMLARIRNHEMPDEDMNQLRDARPAIDGLQLWIDDQPAQSAFHVASQARRLQRRHGLAMVVVDYVGLMEPEDRNARRNEQVGQISHRLKQMARELGVPVIALAQLNRGVEDRGQAARPRLSDLRESGDLEQDGDVIILLHPSPDQPPPPASGPVCVINLDVIVAKNRNGPTGERTVRFVRNHLRFEDGLGDTHTPFA